MTILYIIIFIWIMLNLYAWFHNRSKTEINIWVEEWALLLIVLLIPYLFIWLYISLSRPSIRIHTTPTRPRQTKVTKKRKKRK